MTLNKDTVSPDIVNLKFSQLYFFFRILVHYVQGRRKQSPDGQAQLDVGGKVVNNLRVNRAAKFWTLLFLAVRRRSLVPRPLSDFIAQL